MKVRTTRDFDDFIRRDLEREMAQHERLQSKQQRQAHQPPAPQPSTSILAQVPSKALSWLWPGRIPFGHLTLLDAAPGSGLSLLALTLAACISSGSPLPDGTPTQQGHVLLLAPYDSSTDTLKPRLQAAGGDLEQIMLISPLLQDASLALASSRAYAFPPDLDHLATLIRTLNVRLLIIDPACAIPGLVRSLPALVELAHQTNCAILLTRLSTAPLRSPYRQAILHFLHTSEAAQSIPDILEATSYDREAGRKMLLRMKMAGELVSPARGLYTAAHHPCLLRFSDQAPPVPTVANVPSVASAPTSQSPELANSLPNDVPTVANVPSVASLGPPPVPSTQSTSSSILHVAPRDAQRV